MVPTFTPLQEAEQCEELREYFNSLGANLEKPTGDAFYQNIQQIINVCDLCFNEEKDSDKESVLNSIVSILIQVPQADQICNVLITSFCDKLVEAPEKTELICIRVLQNLFEGIGQNPLLSYNVYCSLIKITGRINQVNLVYDDMSKMKEMFNKSNIGLEKLQKLFRLLHEVLKAEQNEQASKVMIELLSTYTEENASQARDDAHRCIVSFLSDPNTFLMDHLLNLKPVQFLEGELIHDLLTIFVSEKLVDYTEFYKNHTKFVDSLGLSHEQNLQKMRLLTFMQMAESKKEISFNTILEELQLPDNDVEAFVIDVLRTKLVKAKVDQVNKKVLVTSTMHRTFGRPQWQQLRETLFQWQNNLANVHRSITTAICAQYDQLSQMNQISS